jgi:hypothetical protein
VRKVTRAELSEIIKRERLLREVDLSEMDLSRFKFSNVELDHVNLDGSNLHWSSFVGSIISNSTMRRAFLSRAQLASATISDSDLSGSDMTWSRLIRTSFVRSIVSDVNFDHAFMNNAKFEHVDLEMADLSRIKGDLFHVLNKSPDEVPAVVHALQAGLIDGTAYTATCRCLIGTLAKARDCNYKQIPGIIPDSSRLVERWFMGIDRGDNPRTNMISKITLKWILSWMHFNVETELALDRIRKDFK